MSPLSLREWSRPCRVSRPRPTWFPGMYICSASDEPSGHGCRPHSDRTAVGDQCGRCCLFGHATMACSRDERCLQCAGRHHMSACTVERACCLHCGGPHAATEPNCPKWPFERRVTCILASSKPRITRRQALELARNGVASPAVYSQQQVACLRIPKGRPAVLVQPDRLFLDILNDSAGAPPSIDSGPTQPPSAAARHTHGSSRRLSRRHFAPSWIRCRPTASESHICGGTGKARCPGSVWLVRPGYSGRASFSGTCAQCGAVILSVAGGPLLDECDLLALQETYALAGELSLPAVVGGDELLCASFDCVVVTVLVGPTYTCVASVYVHPRQRWDTEFVGCLCDRVGGDLVVCGNFNSRNTVWGCVRVDESGRKLLDSVLRAGPFVANTGGPTFARRGFEGTMTPLLALSSGRWGSVHFPIFLVRHAATHEKLQCSALAAFPVNEAASLGTSLSARVRPPPVVWCRLERLCLIISSSICQLRVARRSASWCSLCFSLDGALAHLSPWRILGAVLRPRVPRCPALSIAAARVITNAQLTELLAVTFCPPPAVTTRSTEILQPHHHPRRELVAPQRYCPTAGILAEMDALCAANFLSVSCARCSRQGGIAQLPRPTPSPAGRLQRRLVNRRHPERVERGSGCAVAQERQTIGQPCLYRPVSLTSASGKVLEAMALRRLRLRAAALDTLAAEQSGFRHFRATADSLADVVTTLEEAKHRGDARYLGRLDVVIAFDQLPHTTINDALSAMGVSGRMLDYLGAFPQWPYDACTCRESAKPAACRHNWCAAGQCGEPVPLLTCS
ncbi:hypothetical protein HPB49_002118 [Dermacentor silvarum]|uniref:Uncharacterized protein n=1 Tax=Dermacentor silvarum TaxID=543639 RepID=A0ACB8CCX3_DERSI|nr:hypothetical protein HPB49_002118 [Dermacentor silvarum]